MHNKVVVDTSVFVSALLSREGASREIIRLCLEKKITPLMGEALFAEYEDVMGRDYVFADCILDKAERAQLLNAFLAKCEWVTVYYLWRPNLRDESDNHLLELAISGGAAAVITHNTSDLKSGDLVFENIKILTPKLLLGDLYDDTDN